MFVRISVRVASYWGAEATTTRTATKTAKKSNRFD